MPREVLKREHYRGLIQLLDEPESAKLLHHAGEIDNPTIRVLCRIPVPLRRIVMMTMEGLWRNDIGLCRRILDWHGLWFRLRLWGVAGPFWRGLDRSNRRLTRLVHSLAGLTRPFLVPLGAARRRGLFLGTSAI
jgi:hypothetical protein